MNYGNIIKKRDFSLLWLGQICSSFGSWIQSVALLIFISELSFSGIAVSGLMMVTMLPHILFGPLIGNYIDGKKRKTVMISADMFRFLLVMLLVPIIYLKQNALVDDWIIIVAIYAIGFLSTCGQIFFGPARRAMIVEILEKDEIKQANSLMGMTNSISIVIGPATGAALVAIFSIKGVFIFNAVTYLISALCVLSMKAKEEKRELVKEKEAVIKKYLKGLSLINKNKEIGYYVYINLFRTICVGLINISFIFVSSNIFKAGKDSVGFLYSTLGIGLIIGSFIIGAIKLKIQENIIYILAILTNAVFSIVYITANVWYIGLIGLFIVGLSDGFQMVTYNTKIQKNIDKKDLGKFFASSNAMVMTTQFFSMMLGGVLFDFFNYRIVVPVIVILTIILNVMCYISMCKHYESSNLYESE